MLSIPWLSVFLFNGALIKLEQSQFTLEGIKPASAHILSTAYENTADEDVSVRLVVDTCPCSTKLNKVEIPKAIGSELTIRKGDRDSFLMEFRAPLAGAFDDYVSLKFVGLNSGREEIVRIAITGRIIQTHKASLNEVVFNDESGTEPIAVAITDLNDQPLDIRINVVDPPILDVVAKPGEMVFSLNEHAFAQAGRPLSGTVEYTYLYDKVMVMDSFPFQVNLSSPCDVEPGLALFGRIEEDYDQIQRVFLHCKDVDLVGVLHQPDYVATKFARMRDKYVVMIRLTKKPPHRFSDDVLLATTNPERPVRIKVTGQVMKWAGEGNQ